MLQNDKKTTPSPMLAMCLLPCVYLMRAHADNYLLFGAGAVLSLLPEAVLLLIINAAFRKKGAPPAVSAPLLLMCGIFFGAVSVFTVLNFADMSGQLSSPYVGKLLLCLLVLLSSVYIASLSEGAVRRICSGVLFMTLALFALTALMAFKNGSFTNLHLSSASPFDDVKKGLFAGLLIFEPDVYFLVICLLGTDIRPSWGRFICQKCCLLLLFTVPVIFTLGEHIRYLGLPAYDMASFSKSVIIERFNGLFMGLVTIAAVTKTALELYALRLCVGRLVIREGAADEKA